MQIDKHISHLLFEHDCVIIPGFGGFVGNYRSARLDKIQHKFSPPYKEISFNRNLIHNDGLLANRISREEKISYEEANLRLKKYSEDLKSLLQKSIKVELIEIGVLYTDSEQNFRFEPNNSRNYLKESYGLSSFHATFTRKAELQSYPDLREKTVEIKFIDRPAVPQKEEKNKRVTSSRRIKKYLAVTAAVLPVLLIFTLFLLNFKKLNTIADKNLNYSSLLPIFDNSSPVYSQREETFKNFKGLSDFDPFVDFPENGLFAISLFEKDEPAYSEEKKLVVKLNRQALQLENNSSQRNSGVGSFHIIGGCFQYKENAEKYIKQWRRKGYQPSIVDQHKGLFRVSLRSFSSRNEALELLVQIQASSQGGAWMLVK